jgi:tetrahydromethanopterin S-methyltransferase subunit G
VKRLSDEIEQKEEDKPPREEIPVPLYFDRYIVSELRSLRDGIVGLDRRFVDFKEGIDERFVQIDERFVQFEKRIDERFVHFDKRIDERFARVDVRIDNLDVRIDNLQESVDKLGANIKWTIGLFSPVIVGILAIIIKMFFGP